MRSYVKNSKYILYTSFSFHLCTNYELNTYELEQIFGYFKNNIHFFFLFTLFKFLRTIRNYYKYIKLNRITYKKKV